MARFCTRENEPLKKWNGIPIYLTTILTALFVVGLLGSAVLMALRSPLFQNLAFSLPGSAWNAVGIFTYPFLGQISFFTPFAIFCFYWWSVGIETHLGRAVLAKLLILLTLVPAAVSTAMWYGMGLPALLFGNYLLTIGLIIAFATLYPQVEVFGWIPFKWFAFACLVCATMMELSGRSWPALISIWVCAGAGFGYIRYCMDQDYDDAVPITARIRGWFRRKPKLRVMPPPIAPSRPAVGPLVDEPDTEVDALLDKIAKSGLSSLTNSERAKLERARQELLKKEHH
jgi:hypothetical protein